MFCRGRGAYIYSFLPREMRFTPKTPRAPLTPCCSPDLAGTCSPWQGTGQEGQGGLVRCPAPGTRGHPGSHRGHPSISWRDAKPPARLPGGRSDVPLAANKGSQGTGSRARRSDPAQPGRLSGCIVHPGQRKQLGASPAHFQGSGVPFVCACGPINHCGERAPAARFPVTQPRPLRGCISSGDGASNFIPCHSTPRDLGGFRTGALSACYQPRRGLSPLAAGLTARVGTRQSGCLAASAPGSQPAASPPLPSLPTGIFQLASPLGTPGRAAAHPIPPRSRGRWSKDRDGAAGGAPPRDTAAHPLITRRARARQPAWASGEQSTHLFGMGTGKEPPSSPPGAGCRALAQAFPGADISSASPWRWRWLRATERGPSTPSPPCVDKAQLSHGDAKSPRGPSDRRPRGRGMLPERLQMRFKAVAGTKEN